MYFGKMARKLFCGVVSQICGQSVGQALGSAVVRAGGQSWWPELAVSSGHEDEPAELSVLPEAAACPGS